jgi:hypothetical protein
VEVALESGGESAGALKWCNDLMEMYRKWAGKRGMQYNEYAHEGATYLTISGFGAYRTLADECGLHVHDNEDEDGGHSRLVARVRVASTPPGELKAYKAGRDLRKVIEDEPVSSTIIRRYRGGAAGLVRDAKRGWRSGKFEEILNGDFDLIGAVSGSNDDQASSSGA